MTDELTPKRDALALFREHARGNASAMADIIELWQTDEEVTDAMNELVQITAIMAEQVAKIRRTDGRDEIRAKIRGFDSPGPLGQEILAHVETVLTSPRGTQIDAPTFSDDPDVDAKAGSAVILAILEIAGSLGDEVAAHEQWSLDALLERVQFLMADDD